MGDVDAEEAPWPAWAERLLRVQARRMRVALGRLARNNDQAEFHRRRSLRAGLQRLEQLCRGPTAALRPAFDALRRFHTDRTRRSLARVMFLLSRRFNTRVDVPFLNQQIKYLVLHNNIRDPALMRLVADNEISIEAGDYAAAGKIDRLGQLLRVYCAIELFCPLDIAFYRVKQGYNRSVMLGLQRAGQWRAGAARRRAAELLGEALSRAVSSVLREGLERVRRVPGCRAVAAGRLGWALRAARRRVLEKSFGQLMHVEGRGALLFALRAALRLRLLRAFAQLQWAGRASPAVRQPPLARPVRLLSLVLTPLLRRPLSTAWAALSTAPPLRALALLAQLLRRRDRALLHRFLVAAQALPPVFEVIEVEDITTRLDPPAAAFLARSVRGRAGRSALHFERVERVLRPALQRISSCKERSERDSLASGVRSPWADAASAQSAHCARPGR